MKSLRGYVSAPSSYSFSLFTPEDVGARFALFTKRVYCSYPHVVKLFLSVFLRLVWVHGTP
jgi:hypothetical protein